MMNIRNAGDAIHAEAERLEVDGGGGNEHAHVEQESEVDTANGSTGRKRKLNTQTDPKMELTAQERQWALQTKEAFEEDDEILAKAFSDMEIASFAIIDQGNIERSLERAQCMQAFKMQYNINDTAEEGIALFRRQEEICPGFWLSVEECPNDDGCGAYACVYDLAKYYPLRFLENPRNFRCNIGAIYYMTLCTQPDLKGLREGYRHIFECDGVTWQNASFKFELRTIDELVSSMPYRRKQVKLLRAPSVLLVVLSLMRPFFPKQEIDAYAHGTEELQMEFPERIDHFYLQPDPERAFEKVMIRTRRLLQRRFENDKTFRL